MNEQSFTFVKGFKGKKRRMLCGVSMSQLKVGKYYTLQGTERLVKRLTRLMVTTFLSPIWMSDLGHHVKNPFDLEPAGSILCLGPGTGLGSGSAHVSWISVIDRSRPFI